ASIVGMDHPSRMIRESSENTDFVSLPGPMTGKFGYADRGGCDFGREILRDIKNFHQGLVITKFEYTFVAQGPRTVCAALHIVLPTISIRRKNSFPGKQMHDTQLHDMQLMIKKTGDHGEPCS